MSSCQDWAQNMVLLEIYSSSDCLLTQFSFFCLYNLVDFPAEFLFIRLLLPKELIIKAWLNFEHVLFLWVIVNIS